MVDREARDKLAEFLHHAASGQAAIAQFRDAFTLQSEDPAVMMAVDAIEDLYLSLLPSDQTTPEEQKRIARIIAFLYSDLEYKPSRLVRPSILIFAIITGLGFGLGLLSIFLGEMPFFKSSPIMEYGIYLEMFLIIGAGVATVLYVIGSTILYIIKSLSTRPRQVSQDVWPFSSVEDYETALKDPRLTKGSE